MHLIRYNKESLNRGTKRQIEACSFCNCLESPLLGKSFCLAHENLLEDILNKICPEALEPDEFIEEWEDCWIYFIGPEDKLVIKIGRASKHRLESRVKELQTGNHQALILHAAMWMPCKTESWLHRVFKGCRIRGEWFLCNEQLERVMLAAKQDNWNNFFQSLV